MNHASLHYRTFIALLVIVSLAFFWLLWPFYGAVFWSAILAILFAPLHAKIFVRVGERRNLAALITLLICILIVIFPVAMITGSLVTEGARFYAAVKSGNLNFGAYLQQILDAMPSWLTHLMDRFGLTDLASIQSRLTETATQASQAIATQAVSIGQDTMQFVISFGIMLYLLFFLLRDGAKLSKMIREAIPLGAEQKQHLIRKFTTVVRATVKGNVAVAAAQGIIGGLAFWGLGIQGPLLWAVVMAFLSLLPAIGASLIWGPVAIYFFVSGAVWKGAVLVFVGVGVIGLVDNLLRPLLVGKDTQMPDYAVLISTLGGMALFGLNGFVIGPLIAALFLACWDLFVTMDDPGHS